MELFAIGVDNDSGVGIIGIEWVDYIYLVLSEYYEGL